MSNPEARFQSRLIAELKKHPEMRDAMIWKVSDRFGSGRPDLQVFLHGITTYFELKVAPNGPSKLQSYYLGKLGRRSALVTYFPKSGNVTIDSNICYSIHVAIEFMVERCRLMA